MSSPRKKVKKEEKELKEKDKEDPTDVGPEITDSYKEI
jgi:hypothetical protein